MNLITLSLGHFKFNVKFWNNTRQNKKFYKGFLWAKNARISSLFKTFSFCCHILFLFVDKIN